ncbi:UDP-glucuronosyltransferase [Paenibacillus sp. FSL R5-0486]|uniref:UDP-glucuronosyltransferase n=1 Tax=unclassified Paenibacillus TaxID=185978 RepID=UPI0030DDB696
MGERKVTILCSGFGLGFYIPGLLAASDFEKRDIATEVLVFESYLEQDKMDHIVDSRKAYHNNFALANLSARMPMDIRGSIDYAQVELLLEAWKAEERYEFISLSGHWIYILDLYREKMLPNQIHVDLLYVDSDLAPSWKSLKKFHPSYDEYYYNACLYDTDKMEIRCEIPVLHRTALPFDSRKRRLVVHGGGWGMGTYQSTIPELASHNYGLDIVAYDWKEAKPDPDHRYWMNDPEWCAWVKSANGLHEFPPYIEITGEDTKSYAAEVDHHWLFDIASEAMAIVAKPGAGTLIDSLASETPLILLEPFGSHELSNLELWESLGFGIRYEKWREMDFSVEVLREMHQAIMNRPRERTNYVDHYCARVALTKG